MAGLAEELQPAIANLWAVAHKTEPDALGSAEFGRVVKVGQNGLTGTPYEVKTDFDASQLRWEIRNVFRTIGAPWFGGAAPTIELATKALLDAYAANEHSVIRLVPLDIADDLPRAAYGSFELRRFSIPEFSEIVDLTRLNRFGPLWAPDVSKLSQFSWLVQTEVQRRYPPTRSTTFLDAVQLSEVGRIRHKKRRFEQDLEMGMFVLILAPWEEATIYDFWTWQPFRMPWIYTVSSDPIRDPVRAPDPATLNWEFRVDVETEEEYEIPTQNNLDPNIPLHLDELSGLWRKAETVLARAGAGEGCFNPLIEHYFLRAFEDEDLDQLLWHIATIDAALGDGDKKRLVKRVRRVLLDQRLGDVFSALYDLRSEYIHGRVIDDSDLWQTSLRDARRIARRVVRRVLDLADANPGWRRKDLLRELVR